MCYPNDGPKINWDIFMTFVLLLTCVITPLHIAFSDEENEVRWMGILNNCIDVLFAIDMIVIFNSAYYDENVEIIKDRSTIIWTYLKGWFIIDLVAIIPFGLLTAST